MFNLRGKSRIGLLFALLYSVAILPIVVCVLGPFLKFFGLHIHRCGAEVLLLFPPLGWLIAYVVFEPIQNILSIQPGTHASVMLGNFAVPVMFLANVIFLYFAGKFIGGLMTKWGRKLDLD